MSFSNIEWVFFDLGETLVDESKCWAYRLERLEAVLSTMDKCYTIQELSVLCERASSEYSASPFRMALNYLGLSELEKRIVGEHAKWPKELEEPTTGAKELLEELSLKYRLGIIANQIPGTEQRLEKWGIRHFFPVILASAEFGIGKPDPSIFHVALSQANCLPEKAVMVGDRIDNDIRPAKLLGIKTIRFLKGWAKAQEPRDEWDVADCMVGSLAEIRDLLLS